MGDLSLLALVVLGFMPAWLSAVKIQEPSTETIIQAKGQSVVLGCTYVLDPGETGTIDIEWSKMNPDSTGLDSVILTYMDSSIVSKGPQSLMSRLSFLASDPSKGDASVNLNYLEVSDSATYQCKVKRNPGVDSRKVKLDIQVAPSHTRCWIDGDQTYRSDVTLKCQPAEGTTPLSYTWVKIAGAANPATPVLNTNSLNGDLLIKNLSDVYTGRYQCTVANMVGSGKCETDLSASSVNRTGIIVGAVFGALLLLLLLLLIIWCLICFCNKRRYEKEVNNEIREDVIAPLPSRSNSHASTIRTAAGYRPHHISYSLRRNYNEAPIEEPSAPPYSGSDPMKDQYNSPVPTPEPIFILPENQQYKPYNVQRVGGIPVMVPAQSREGFIV